MKNYLTVKQTPTKFPAFTEPGLRWLIFNADKNGLSQAIVRIGRKVLIDEEAFLSWIDMQRGNAQ